jgi:hypothetical protein
MSLIVTFAPLFSNPVFEPAKVLFVGSILAMGERTVTASLRGHILMIVIRNCVC